MSDLEKRITAKMILDDSGYSSKLKGINSELKNNQAQFKLASASVSAFGRDNERLKSVQEALSRQTELQSKKVALYRENIEKTSNKMQENIRARDNLKRSLEEANRKYQESITLYGKESDQAKKAKDEVERLSEKHEKAQKRVENNAKAIQNYDTNLNKANAQLVRTQGELNKVNDELAKSNNKWLTASKKLDEGSKKFTNFGEKAENVGGKLTTHVSLPLLGVGAVASKVGMDFEAQMDKVAAISGATGDNFKKLEAKAEEMGAKTKFSATNAGEAMEYMAMAGWKTGDMIDGIEPIMNLAIASGEELGSTSDIVTDALTAFGLKAKDAGEFSDVLAAASSNANTNVGMMGETFKYAAPVAGSLGYTVQDTALAIGLMANSGIKASQAGTALRAGLTNLVKPTDAIAAAMKKYNISVTDSNGKVKSFKVLMEELRNKLGHLDKATQAAAAAQIFGKEAMSGWLSIINASQSDFDKLSGAIDTSEGATAKMAKTMSENAKGSIAEMTSALEGAAIKAFKALAPVITQVANTIGDLANKFSSLSPETQDFIIKSGMIAVAVGPVISGIGKISSGIGGIISVAGKLAGAIGGTTAATTAATAATSAATVAVEGATVATAGATTAATGLGAGLAGIALPVLGATAVIAGVGYAGYKTAQYLNESATPAVDLFADKAVYSTEKVMTAHGEMTTKVQTDTVKISKSTQDAVQSYLDMDKKASSTLMDLSINSDKFTKEAKDKVIKNFADMSKKASNLSDEQREAMTVDFKKLVSDTGTLTKKNKDEIIKQYTAMVNGTKNLNDKQKNQTIKSFTDTLNKSTAITKNQSQEIQKIYKEMASKVKDGLNKKQDDEIKSLKDFFSKSNALTTKEEADILKKTEESWNKKKNTVDVIQQKITSIIENAANNHRKTTEEENREIEKLQKELKENAIKTLSQNEVESKVILERMKDYNGNITAEMASEKIKKLNELRDSSVKAANEECDKRIAEVIRLRDETGSIGKEQADKLIEEAKRQKEETVKAAEDTRSESVEKLTSMNSDISKGVNTTTGDVLTNWDRIKNWWNNFWPDPKQFKMETVQTSVGGSIPQHWSGTSYFKGGFTTLHERGYELYDLPSGTRIYNHESSEEMVKQTAEEVAKGILGNLNINNQDKESNVVIKVYMDSKEIGFHSTKEVMKNMNNRKNNRNLVTGGI